ncbi:ankyrin repeat and KH domain-containing protein 1 isoform X5 [Hippopotamus amphibius kiboko]|uniref:ankyrin repeat and KH domain-containing protein 1 isoform X5 n=1 Tax=Hippopotamus amphibius kiboko TaxID=575201 RepID=UPI00259A48AD|nr:ankyrin repeat and KH domain-containing protein 1 isoform X5 [Hippopotamus amphibius kiboko]
MLTDGGGGGTSFEEDLDSVAPRSAPAGASEPPQPGGVGLGIRTVRLFGEAGPAPGVGGGGSGAGGGDAALDFKLAAAVLRTGGGGGASGSDEDEVSEVESFILDQEDLDNPVLKTTSEIFLSSTAEGADLRTVDPETQARLEALLEAAGIGKLSTADGKAFADPEVLRRLTSSVSCALDEAAAALTRMRAENSHSAGQVDTRSLAEACSDGDVNAVRKLLDEGRSVNEHTEEGESLLCLACSAGYYELAQVLLAMHANVEDRGNKGDITPLMAASSGGYLDIVKLLLLHDADVNSQSATGNTALTYACAGGFVDIVKVLLNEGANIEDHNENGHTPLMEAASAGHVEVARVLLDHGAGINTHSNEFKESALTLACYKGHLDMVRFLLDAGADQEHKTDEMHTALMEACMDGHVEVARLLLDSGAQVNMPADSFESPLTLAACGGHVELAALLIERGANLEEVNDEGYTPLMEAAREGHEEMVALLLAQGANINAQTEETQETALTLACCGGFSEVADFLIKAGADIELGCSTPLMEASQEGHLELVKYLLAAGANVHATTATGDTALTYACENGHTDVADVLLQAGADLEHESEGGRTPLMKAARAGHLCTVQFLISKGANVNRATANNDHTVVSLACAGGHLAVVELLLAHGADPTHRLKDGSTMLIEAAKGGHTNVVSYLLDYPNNVLSVPTTDVSQLTPPCQDQAQVPRVPMHTLAMVVPPQEPDRTLQENSPAVLGVQKGTSKQKSSSLQVADQDVLPPFHPYQPLECIVEETEGKLNELGQRISAIEKAQLKSLELIQGEPLNKDKIEELKKNREEQVQKKKKILKELQKVERQLQMKTQQQFTKEYLETKGQKDTVSLHQQCSHRGVFPEGEGDGSLPEDHFSELPQVDTILFKDNDVDDEQQSPPSAEQIDFVPIQPLSSPQCNFSSELGSNGTNSLELQKVSGNHQIIGQPQIAITGHDQGLLVQEPDGLMVATPAQTLTDTLDDLIAAVSSRVPTGSNSSSQATECLTPEPCSQSPSNVASQSMPPVYPSVDIDAHTESNHDTALTLACAGGHEELVSVLIARDAKIEHRDKKGFTPLILAATAGHVGVVEILLDKGGDIEAQSERTKDTPLSLACSGGRQEVVDLLLARGANKEHRNVSDYTPLSLAASGGYVNIIKILLNAGAEINSRTGSKLGISPLMLAAMNGHVPAVKLLLDMGSDINAQIETNRNTALTLACFQGRAEVVSLLLDRKANVEHRAKTGLTPLMEAASGGYAEVGRVLLDKGADVNAPPVPSSRDTALTIAADKGHYKFCELLINRGAHIDVRNKKGNTPLWLASNGGHFDVVQLLVQASADVDAADNRKITPLMSAFRKGHVKVVQYLVKEVNQFPSDIECMRYIATITDKELLKKCHQCVETIVKAKDQQAAEANKNASILLKELDLEKSREESRKQALAAKREKRKEKRKKKKEEQKRKQEEDEENKPKENSELPEDEDEEENDEDVEQEVPIEPPSATTTTTIGISATSATFTNVFGKKRANVVTTPSTNRKNKKNKTKETPPTAHLILPEQHISLAQQKADKNKINGEPRGGGAGGNSDSDNLDSTDCNSESSSGGKSQELNFTMDVNSSSDRRYPSLLLHSQEEKTSAAASKTQTRLEGEVNPNSLSTTYKSVSLPLSSSNIKLNLTSPKRGQKREEGWKEVVRRSKKLSVPASVVSRIMGRGGCNITAIQDVTGAHIDVDKQKDKNGERMITIRGGTESTRYAVQLINALIQDPAKELEDLIPKNHIRTPASTKAIHANFSSGVGTTAASSKNAFPLGAPSLVTSQATTLSTFQPTNKLNKNVPANVRSSFPVSLPLAYPHPHFALLAAQTMQQIRHPRLPMAQFGGTFSPSPNTWGPFPVRPVNPGNTNSSPKHNNTGRLPNQNGTVLPSESAGLATASCPITVSSVVAASQQLCVTNTRTPSSVRKQLFACVPKTSPPATVISSVTSTCSSLPSVSSAPITSGQVPTTFLPASTPQAQLSSQKMESFSAMPAPKEKVSTQDQSMANLCTPSSTANSCSSSASNTPGAPETHPSGSPTPPSNNTQEEAQPSSVSDLSPMSMPFASNSETTPLTLASPRLVAADNQDTNNLPQLAVPAPRVSHRMQPRGSFYSVVPNATIHQDPQSIFVTNPVPLTPPQGPPAAVQLSSAMNIMNGSQMHINPANKSLPPTFGPATLFNHFSSLFDSSQVPANQGWGDGPLSSRVAADASFTVQSAFLGNSVLGHLENMHPDNSKAPGFRSPSQRVSTSPVGLPSIDPSGSSPSSSSAPLTSFSSIPGTRVFLQGPAPVGTPSFNRQHFSPHPWTSASNSCDSPIPSVSSGSSSPLSATSAPPTLGQPKGGSASQDRKIPPPIGTERLARIRQGGSVAQAPVGTSFVAPVGHSGIWSFGVNAVSEGLSGWSQSVIGNHPMHQQLSDPSTFSQHQPMERDDSGMAAPSNIFHQPMASSFVDFSKGLPISMYGGTIIPSHPQLADVPGGPLFNGLHNPDPAWNPMIKVIQNSTECTDAQQASLLPSVPALKGEISSPQLTRPKKRVGQPMVASPNQRHQDHLRPKVPAGVQELTHCPDAPLLPPSDSRGYNSSNSPTLQTRGAEGAEGDRGRDTR